MERSSRPEYSIPTQTIATELAANSVFIAQLRRCVHLVLTAWGWDTTTNTVIPTDKLRNPKYQKWSSWPVRLYKMGRCCQKIGGAATKDLFESCQLFAKHIAATYGGSGSGSDAALKFRSSHDNQIHEVLSFWDETVS